ASGAWRGVADGGAGVGVQRQDEVDGVAAECVERILGRPATCRCTRHGRGDGTEAGRLFRVRTRRPVFQRGAGLGQLVKKLARRTPVSPQLDYPQWPSLPPSPDELREHRANGIHTFGANWPTVPPTV